MTYKKSINGRQVKFCHEYLLDGHAGQAALRAGYKPKAAASKGSRLLQDEKVKAYLGTIQAEQRKKYVATAEKVMMELSLIAFSDVSDYLDEKNAVCDLQQVEKNKRKAISSISVMRTENKNGSHEQVSLKMHNKMSALKTLVAHLGVGVARTFSRPETE